MSHSELVADLRSDTVTRPTAEMREAMMAAPLGDDVFSDDPTVNRLEAVVAERLGKEDALFVPSGTMANQLALRVHTRVGDAVLAHAKCHIRNYESGAPAAISGVTMALIHSADGALPVEALEAAYHDGGDPHMPPSSLVAMENTHNACGGVVLDSAAVHAAAAWARDKGLALHLDGARLFNAAVASGATIGELAAPFDSVSVCFSKGLGAPIGSALAGSKDGIRRARRFRKMLGGGMRQVGFIAAAALHALDHHVDRLAHDHQRARAFAEGLAGLGHIEVDAGRVQTNIVYFSLAADHPLAAAGDSGMCRFAEELRQRGVLLTGKGRSMRAVAHLDVDDAAFEGTLAAMRALLS